MEDGGRLMLSARDGNATNSFQKSPVGHNVSQEWTAHLVLADHPYDVGAIAWSPDDSIVVTGAEHLIKMWNIKVNCSSFLLI